MGHYAAVRSPSHADLHCALVAGRATLSLVQQRRGRGPNFSPKGAFVFGWFLAPHPTRKGNDASVDGSPRRARGSTSNHLPPCQGAPVSGSELCFVAHTCNASLECHAGPCASFLPLVPPQCTVSQSGSKKTKGYKLVFQHTGRWSNPLMVFTPFCCFPVCAPLTPLPPPPPPRTGLDFEW